jgi:RHS repeat-associated protein
MPQVLDDGTFKYVYGLGRIAEVGPGTTTHYYLPDGLGSTMALVDSSGAAVNTYDYDVFGAIRTSTGSQANEFKFTGEQVDSSTGLQYLRARYYDQTTGRLLSKDPLAYDPRWTESSYGFVDSNPTTYRDPSGLAKEAPSCPAADQVLRTDYREIWIQTAIWCPASQPSFEITTHLAKHERLWGIWPRTTLKESQITGVCFERNQCRGFGIFQDLEPGEYTVRSSIQCGMKPCPTRPLGGVRFSVDKAGNVIVRRQGKDPFPQNK